MRTHRDEQVTVPVVLMGELRQSSFEALELRQSSFTRVLELRQSSFVATSPPDGGGMMWGERVQEGIQSSLCVWVGEVPALAASAATHN